MSDEMKENGIELSVERSEEFARNFELFKLGVHVVDWEYARACVTELRGQARFQETIAVLNPGYSPRANERISVQAEALEHFVKAVDLLKKADELMQGISAEKGMRDEIARMFL